MPKGKDLLVWAICMKHRAGIIWSMVWKDYLLMLNVLTFCILYIAVKRCDVVARNVTLFINLSCPISWMVQFVIYLLKDFSGRISGVKSFTFWFHFNLQKWIIEDNTINSNEIGKQKKVNGLVVECLKIKNILNLCI